MLAAKLAEFLHLQAIRGARLIFLGRVISVFALGALKLNDSSHSIFDFRFSIFEWLSFGNRHAKTGFIR